MAASNNALNISNYFRYRGVINISDLTHHMIYTVMHASDPLCPSMILITFFCPSFQHWVRQVPRQVPKWIPTLLPSQTKNNTSSNNQWNVSEIVILFQGKNNVTFTFF